MSSITEINTILRHYSGVYPESPDTDIYKDMGIVGDDFHEMIEDFAKKYQVDMSEYLWYFHTDEEGHSFGGVFFKPPYERVQRIPVTPQMLADFMVTKKWKVEYPPHQMPKHRPDLTINKAIGVTFLIGVAIWILTRIFN